MQSWDGGFSWPKLNTSSSLMTDNMPLTPRPTDEPQLPQVIGRSSAPEADDGSDEAVFARIEANSWLADNERALASSNSFFARHGLPLARFRSF
jgi:hypothetical protein